MTKPIQRITRAALLVLERLFRSAAARGTETHVYLLGTADCITKVISPGTPLERAAMTQPDIAAAGPAVAAELAAGRLLKGEAHLHPKNMIGPSGGDFQMIRSISPDEFPGYRCVVGTFLDDDSFHMTCHSADRDGHIIEHQLEVIDDGRELPDDDYCSTFPPTTSQLRLLQIGVGSGGCQLAVQAAVMGFGRLTLVDPDRFEAHNLTRHIADRRAIGKYKATWMRSYLRQRTESDVQAVVLEASPKHEEQLEQLIIEHDIVSDATGHQPTNLLLAQLARTHRRPYLSAGAFPKGIGGYVFIQERDGACINCVFGITRKGQADTNATASDLERRYGFTPEALHAQLGLWADVSVTASLQGKLLADFLRSNMALPPTAPNLIIIDNKRLELIRVRIRPSATCPVCQPQPVPQIAA